MFTEHSIRKWQLLLITDDAFTLDAAHAALHRHDLPVELTVERDSVSALNHIRGYWSNDVTAELIIMDLHLRGVHGFEMLAEIRGNARLSGTPIVLLTDSFEEQEILTSYEQEDVSYACRPFGARAFAELISELAARLETITLSARHDWQFGGMPMFSM